MFTRKSILHVFIALLAVMMLLAPTSVRAASLAVNSLVDTVAVDGDCTLREAIQNANNNVATNSDCTAGNGADTITFSVSGTITLGSILPYIADTAGLTIDGTGQTVTINGNNASQIAAIQPNVSLTLKKLTITNGYTYSFGGGITNGGTLVIENSIFSTNKAGYGGGSIYSRGTVNITDSIISNNSANMGGGIYNDGGTLVVSTSIISGNIATKDEGGGIYVFSGTLNITDSTFSNNISILSSGGGIQNDVGTLNIANSTFSGNSAINGGGIFNRLNLIITNSTFSTNSADAGGGIYNSGSPSSLTIINSTISDNSGNVSNSGSTTLKNTIIADSNFGENCDGAITADIHNLATDSTCGGATQKTSAEINLGPLASNGGSTQTMALLTGSAAIDAGDNSVCPTTDQRGTVRPQGNACDVGAFESSESGGTPTFADVPFSHPLHDYIEALYDAGYTAGCSTIPLMYCPDTILDRAQSAVFMLRGQMGAGYTPPPAPWDTFGDDWTGFEWAEPWAEGMWQEGLTAGCQPSPLMYCPATQLPRVEASVFGLRMKYGVNYAPPAGTGTLFADMTDTSYWGIGWAEQAYRDGLLPACGTDSGTGKPLFCPSELVDRAWGAYLIVKAKDIPLP